MVTFLANAQSKQGIYVDRSGVIRWEKDHKEAAFFGTNYTVPFAYGYRAINRLGQNVEQAIKDDVYHFSRLGFDAFRVHVWDQEISDVNGNLINNEHLRLFDFLIAELKKRNIKTLVTPIAFWGNGYPERDENTKSFSYLYGKQKALIEEEAFKAQENFLRQFFKHKNPYTGFTYQQDPDIFATEVNNEPQHSGLKERATEYINRMVASIKSTGWRKPIFYNISESPWYAAAIVKADVVGHSFQWYPTGLVAGHTLKGNFLPNVAIYKIPFDTIPAFKNRAKIVYEFDAGDVMAPIMYPAMARSFRTAGFQWATQFAYDPMATAYGNTEYQTHYLNLAYTPSKAISMLIASKIFHLAGRLDQPVDKNVFGPFKIDYQNSVSEMNSETEFYHSNSTSSTPVDRDQLQSIAGVGTSQIVNYQGTGSYFIDKIQSGAWRLEVMPDAIQIEDPFERASPKKTVTAINWKDWLINIKLPDLGEGFTVEGLNQGNTFRTSATENGFKVRPGTYLLVKKGSKIIIDLKRRKELSAFVAPKTTEIALKVIHHPVLTATADTPLPIKATIVGLGKHDSVFVQVTRARRSMKINLQENQAYQYSGAIPAELIQDGVVNYHIIVRKEDGASRVFPSDQNYEDTAWDRLESPSYEVFVAKKGAIFEIFNPGRDTKSIDIYNPDWSNSKIESTSGENPTRLNLRLLMAQPKLGQLLGFQNYFADKLYGRQDELGKIKMLVIKVKSAGAKTKLKIGLIDKDANFFATEITATEDFEVMEIPLSKLKKDAQLLLPRPYPGFLPLYYRSENNTKLELRDIEKLELTLGYDNEKNPVQILIETIYLK